MPGDTTGPLWMSDVPLTLSIKSCGEKVNSLSIGQVHFQQNALALSRSASQVPQLTCRAVDRNSSLNTLAQHAPVSLLQLGSKNFSWGTMTYSDSEKWMHITIIEI